VGDQWGIAPAADLGSRTGLIAVAVGEYDPGQFLRPPPQPVNHLGDGVTGAHRPSVDESQHVAVLPQVCLADIEAEQMQICHQQTAA
jgi:hypothetical protein